MVLEPYTLVDYKKGLYVAGLSHHHHVIRTFALDGFREEAWLKGDHFDCPADCHPAQLTESAFGLIRGEPTRVRIRFDASGAVRPAPPVEPDPPVSEGARRRRRDDNGRPRNRRAASWFLGLETRPPFWRPEIFGIRWLAASRRCLPRKGRLNQESQHRRAELKATDLSGPARRHPLSALTP